MRSAQEQADGRCRIAAGAVWFMMAHSMQTPRRIPTRNRIYADRTRRRKYGGRIMNHGRARWLSMVLACLLLFSCVAQADIQASKVTPIPRSPRRRRRSPPIPLFRVVDLATIPGVEVIRNGKSVTYKFKQPIHASEQDCDQVAGQEGLGQLHLAGPTEGVMGMNVTQPLFSQPACFLYHQAVQRIIQHYGMELHHEDAVKITKSTYQTTIHISV